jgi:putative transposase
MIPKREPARNSEQTYFVTSSTWERRALFLTRPFAELFVAVLQQYRGSSYLLHEFVLMPDHFHLLITPNEALERTMQMIKGGFSFRVKKELGSNAEIWQRGFSDHRIRDWEDYRQHREYVYANPVRRGVSILLVGW